MKNLFILILAVLLTGCGSNETTTETKVDVVVEAPITGGFSTKAEEAPLANPVFMYGSDFLTFFKSLRKMGKFDDMVNFTSSASVEKHGRENLVDFYSNKYKNVSEVKLTNSEANSDGTITLYYTNINMATKNAIDITVVVENDTAKLVLPNKLTKFPK